MKAFVSRLGADASGIAATEFAFVAPVLILLTAGAIDLGYIQWTRAQLSGATAIAGRQIVQARSQDASRTQLTTAARQAVIEQTITSAMSQFAKPNGQNMTVSIRKYANFSSMGPEPYTDGSLDPNGNGVIDPSERNGRYDPGETYTELNGVPGWQEEVGTDDDLGGVGDVVKIDVTYPIRPLFSYTAAVFGVNGAITIGASTVFRNEPD